MPKPNFHVVHVVPALFGSEGIVGGAERYAFELARAMSREVPTTLVTFGREDMQRVDSGLRVCVLGNSRFVRGERTNPVSARIVWALRAATVVHCHQRHVLTSSLVAAYCRLTGRRVFVTDLGGGGWDISAYIPTDRWYHGHLHISQYSRRVFGHENNPRAQVILGGVDADKFSPGASSAPRRDVLYVGRILPHKGINYLIEALPSGMSLTVAGSPDDPQFFADLRRLAEGKKVTFRHDMDDVDLVQAYREAACVVLPSVYRTMYGRESDVPELLGQTLLEAMACGAVVIGTDVASIPEVVEDGVTGFIVPPNDPRSIGDRLQWLATHLDQRRAMGIDARRRVQKHFMWSAVVQRCLAAYGR
jgi:glycosyltransferase involved in cell wall biosynthesis